MRWSSLLLLLLACAEPPEGDAVANGDTSLLDTGLAEPEMACGDEDPMWGPYVQADVRYGEWGPRLTLFAVPTDADGALYSTTLRVWHDRVVNGSVSTVAPPSWEITQDWGPHDCGLSGGALMLWDIYLEEWGLSEGDVELAIQLVDADGHPSDLKLFDLCLIGTGDSCVD